MNENIRLTIDINGLNEQNKYQKFQKAIRSISKQLGVPIKKEELKGEKYVFASNEDLAAKWYNEYSRAVNSLYELIISMLSLPAVRILSKALTYKGKIVYSPETGEPIKKADWEVFIKQIEKFLSDKFPAGEKIVLEASALGKVLARMTAKNKEQARKARLKDITHNGKPIESINTLAQYEKLFGREAREDAKRIEIAQQSAGQKVTRVADDMKNTIRQVIVDGVRQHKSKSDISQTLFDKMSGHNRDFQRIAEYEIQTNQNVAYLKEEVYNTVPGEKTYFQRIEILDENTCSFCRKMHGEIAVWSDRPLTSDRTSGHAKYVLWDGKEWDGSKNYVSNGAFHPYCRGTWIRWYPGEPKAERAETGTTEIREKTALKKSISVKERIDGILRGSI